MKREPVFSSPAQHSFRRDEVLLFPDRSVGELHALENDDHSLDVSVLSENVGLFNHGAAPVASPVRPEPVKPDLEKLNREEQLKEELRWIQDAIEARKSYLAARKRA